MNLRAPLFLLTASASAADAPIQGWIDTAKSPGRHIPEPRGKLAYA